mmetsp:Transcript_75882/g.138761  ORF Transcript_75882/g.138761 Transcript_75882/m.138761 type:complete len:324 (+) Transcript_75882:113-1084(+)
MAEMLRAPFGPNAAGVQYLLLPNPLDSSTWMVQGAEFGDLPLHAVVQLLPLVLGRYSDAYVQFRMDERGRHEYVSLGEAVTRVKGSEGSALTVYNEDFVKEKKAEVGDDNVLVLTARIKQPGEDVAASPDDDLTLCPPMGLYRNYTVCDDLTLGRTQRIMLSDESTLRSGVERNKIEIFNYLTLIVNCHENSRANRPGKYSVGTATPELVFEPIHQLFGASPEVVIDKMNHIQERMWDCLQRGSIAVHCLAGVHRAPTVVCCHYLWRHYHLGHKDVCPDIKTIYQRLSRVRSGVEPLSYIQIIHLYEKYLKDTYAAGGGDAVG